MAKRKRSPEGSSYTIFFDKDNTEFLDKIKKNSKKEGKTKFVPAIVNDIITEKRTAKLVVN